MRSPERRAAAILLLATVAFAGVTFWTSLSRSLIPQRIAGTVDDIEVRAEKHRGRDDVWLVRIDGEQIHVDAATATRLRTGDRVRKEAWARELMVGQATWSLPLSADSRGQAWVLPLVLAGAAAGCAVSLAKRR